MTPEGLEYLTDFDEFAYTDIFDGNYDFAVLKFLYQMDEPVPISNFPEYMIEHAPTVGKELNKLYAFENHLMFSESLKKYITALPNRVYEINKMGKKYFEHLQSSDNKKVKIINRPLLNIENFDNSKHDYSTHTIGDNNQIAPNSDIKESFNKNEETAKTKELTKKGFSLTKKTLYWTIGLGITAILISILIAKHVI